MPEPLDDPERIIVAAIELHARGNVAALERVFLKSCGKPDTTFGARPEMIPVPGPRP